jgi:hypothetical protein
MAGKKSAIGPSKPEKFLKLYQLGENPQNNKAVFLKEQLVN